MPPSIPARPSFAPPTWSLEGATRASFELFLRWAMLVSAAVVFLGLAGDVLVGGAAWLDAPIFQLVDDLRSPALTSAMRVFTVLGNTGTLIAIAVLAVLGLFAGGRRHAALFVALSGAGGGAMNQIMKFAVQRPRPILVAHLVPASGYAFPSGHAMASAAIFGALAIVVARRYPKAGLAVGISAALVVALVGASRVYLGVHYPSDVIAGWALGVSWPLWLRPLMSSRARA